MSSLPYSHAEGADPSMIPLNQLRAPAANASSRSVDSSSSDVAPPAHYPHPHGFDNTHFYQGIDPGYQPDAANEEEDHVQPSGSGSGLAYQRQDRKAHYAEEHATYPPDAKSDSPAYQHAHGGGQSDSEDETDDFDWGTSDGEGEAAPEQEGGKRNRAKRGRKLYQSLMRLTRPVRVVAIGLLGTAIALVPFIVVLVAFKDRPARAQVEVWSIWIAIIWAAACGTFLVIEWVPSVILRLGVAFYGKAPEAFKLYVEVIIAVLIWIKLLLCISWAWISLGGVLAIEYSSTNRPPYFKWVFLVIQAVFATSLLVLVEKFLLQIVAINFHKTALKDRLENNQAALKALVALQDSKYLASGYNSRRHTTQWGKSFGFGSSSRPGTPGPRTPGTGGHASRPSRDGLAGYFGSQPRKETPPAGDSPKAKRGPATPTEKEQRKANFANQLSDALASATMKDSKQYRNKGAKSQLSARRLAKKLFTAIGHHRKTLMAEDFYPFFSTPEHAREAFKHFDADNNGDISKEEMRDAVQGIYRERRALTTSLKDMSSAVSKLDGVLLGTVLIIIIFIWLLIFNGENTVANIAPLSTFVLSFSFVFGNSMKTLFESMVFIFATHPYDVGDLVCVDGNFMFVESFGLISTVFRTVTNENIVAPNAMLSTSKMIFNCRRSGNQWEVTNIQVGYDTTLLETIDDLRARLRAWVKSKDREWGGGLEINLNAIDTQENSVELTIAMEHRGNWQKWGDRWSRRTQLMRQVKVICDELGIKYQLPVQPVTFQPRHGPPAHAPQGPRVPSAGATPLPVGGMGRRQMTKAETATAALKK